MYRLASAAVTTDTADSLSASYTYTDDLLTEIETESTTYSFTYGDFALRSAVKIGSYTLASYSYTDDRNYYLDAIDYGNGDEIQYEYDNKGRITKQTYEDGGSLTYKYNNNGDLHSIVDSGAGITTTYYYDLSGRLMKYTTSGTRAHTVEYSYDTLNNLTSVKDSYNGTTSYAYDDDNRVTSVTNGYTSKAYEYDTLGRLSKSLVKEFESTVLTLTPTYYAPASGTTSSRISRYQISSGSYSNSLTYGYDDNGNITSISGLNLNVSYVYDSQNQLIRENNSVAYKTWTWEYDNAGNILNRKEYPYTTGTLGAPTSTKTYTYGDSQWGDLLTNYNGKAITYDAIGNMLTYGSKTFTWEHGRQLAALDNWQFSYDMDGMRLERYDSSTNTRYRYYYTGGQLMSMYVDSDNTYAHFTFYYDANGTPISARYYVDYWEDDLFDTYDSTFYYVTNVQGDVIALVDEAGEQLARYEYDAWGKPVLTDYFEYFGEYGYEDVEKYAFYNPLRYRGYVYDAETGLYYLQSRYYDPEIGRFINADSYVATGQGLLGNNMFAYCGNNPIVFCDPCGTCIHRWYFLGLVDCEACKQAKKESKKEDKSFSLYDNHDKEPDKVFHEEILAIDYSEPSISLSDATATLGSASVTVLTGGWEFENVDLSVLDVGYAEVSAGLEDGQLNVGAMASLWAPSVTFTLFDRDVTISGHFGSIGATFCVGTGKIKVGASYGIGFSLSLD